MKNFIRKNLPGWLLLLPGVILFAFFVWIPLLESVKISLYSAKGMRLIAFVGLKNYRDVFMHPDFWPAMRNTFLYTLWSLVIGFAVPIVMGLFISELVRGKSALKIGVYLPNIVPGMAMVLMWSFIFRPGATGVLNILLGKLGFQPQMWLSNPKWTIPLIVVALTWKGAGATALLYVAGLQGIDPELYEAAMIDGAGIWKRLRYVTLPGLYNLIRMLFILQIISVFQILYEPLVMTNGGPNNASISIMQLVYRYAFEKYDYPKASSVSVIICIVLVILTAVYTKLNKKQEA
ncbi:carbohydrate ABC transporter permease [Treponema brennaborense]|uniref:ABC-type transporter, integral membrane subunit n=1 Tax=Treponema brennaborense (strain DSM 12168 / CIP 105900 / DD5/3) TaxID=906968 RepID=F4LLU7_TREBD|nr:sugar ABC transporter permease [Treponema brennaborense]AEE15639.1 ABC-type transporter, integral membrane subunit [Treponema brennaborense DSM 12168]